MAITVNEVQVTWSAANNLSVSAASTGTSDAMAINAAAFGFRVVCKADNNGTPASGDYVTFRILMTGGDPDGASTDEYTTSEAAVVVGVADTNQNDPSIVERWFPGPVTSVKIFARNNAASNAITVSALVLEQRG